MEHCFWCGRPMTRWTRDHLISKAIRDRHGLHALRQTSVVKACEKCNTERSRITYVYDLIQRWRVFDGRPQPKTENLFKYRNGVKRLAEKYWNLTVEKVGEPTKTWILAEIKEVLGD